MRTEKDRMHERAMEEIRGETELQRDRRDFWSGVFYQEFSKSDDVNLAIEIANEALDEYDENFG